MRTTCLRAAVLSLLAATTAGCGGSGSIFKPPPNCTPASPATFAYVSNYGDATISMYTVNSCTGALTATTPATVPTGSGNGFNSESIVVDPSGKFLYAANLESNASDLATISMYTIDPSTGVLTPTTPATVPTGFFPQGIAVDPTGQFVYTANSDDNTVSMFKINPNTGVLTPTSPPTVATGWSPLSVTIDPSGKYAYVSNQDDGTISMYTVNASTGVLTPNTPPAIAAGSSPFAATVDPSGKFLYVPDEGFTIVSMFTINPNTGILSPNSPATIGTQGQPFPVVVNASGTFAYVADQASGVLSIYAINSNGTLTSAGAANTGNDPVSIALTH